MRWVLWLPLTVVCQTFRVQTRVLRACRVSAYATLLPSFAGTSHFGSLGKMASFTYQRNINQGVCRLRRATTVPPVVANTRRPNAMVPSSARHSSTASCRAFLSQDVETELATSNASFSSSPAIEITSLGCPAHAPAPTQQVADPTAAVVTKPIRSRNEALQLAEASLEAMKDLCSYVAEYSEDDHVQQQVLSVIDIQQKVVAALKQQQQQDVASTTQDTASPDSAHSHDSLAAQAAVVNANSSTVGTAATAAASIDQYPIVVERVSDVYESTRGFLGRLDSPTSSFEEPVTEQLRGIWAGVAASRGRKNISMEDCSAVHSVHPEHGVLHHSEHDLSTNALLAGVYDGHGGRSTAAYAAAQFPAVLHKELSSSSELDQQRLLRDVYHKLDQSWANHGHAEQSGSTAVTAMINKGNLVVANAGDSVAVLARGGSSHRLSHSHKLSCPHELARVTAAGGSVTTDRRGNPRLMQSEARWQRYVAPLSLAVTRGFGDFGFKGVGGDLVIPTPHVAELALTPEDQLLLLTSDGVTDVMADDSIMEIALDALAKARDVTDLGSDLASAAAAAVKDAALAAGAWDHLSVVAVMLDWQS